MHAAGTWHAAQQALRPIPAYEAVPVPLGALRSAVYVDAATPLPAPLPSHPPRRPPRLAAPAPLTWTYQATS